MMESGYKHFSHAHNLIMHEMPEDAEVSCSGCNSSASKTVYVCWPCNFFLHDQCFHASRSRKHPSHPAHPLTLLPYPTYPSNSFYCNSCKIIGTGFSYSCPHCDFDLHVQCAYSISTSTNFPQPHQVTSHNNLSYPHQEMLSPHLHGQTWSRVPNVASLSVPAQYATTITQESYMGQNVSPFLVPLNVQNPYVSQNFTSVIPTSAQNPSIPQNIAFASVPTSAPVQQSSNSVEPGQNPKKNQGIKHFSHPHSLLLVNLKDGKKQIACSGCQETLVGKGFSCAEENCRFQLHESCFFLERAILHESHPPHPLALLYSSPYDKENGKFTCKACFKDGTGFSYHCSICEYHLHVKCAGLKEEVKRDDHEHVLKLFYECPLMGEDYTFYCDVCNRVVPPDRWTYYCKECDYGTHLDCVDREECEESSRDPVVDAKKTNLQTLEEAVEISRKAAISRANMLDNIYDYRA